jgi:hypothetical protein
MFGGGPNITEGDVMKALVLSISVLLLTPCLSLAGGAGTVWSSEDLSIVRTTGTFSTSYKMTLSRKAAGDLKDVLNTVNEHAIAMSLERVVKDPFGKILIIVVTRNVSSFKYELNKTGTIGERGIVINVWVPNNELTMIESVVSTHGLREGYDACLALVNPWSWKITPRSQPRSQSS